MDTRVEIIVVQKVLHNLVGHYHFWGISPKSLTLFIRLFLARRHAQAGHETTLGISVCWIKMIHAWDFKVILLLNHHFRIIQLNL